MKLVIREEAANDLDLIHDWIEKDSPTTAVQMIRRIRAKVDLLLVPGMAEIGRPGPDAGNPRTDRSAVYESHPNAGEIVVLGVFHGAQDR